MQGKCLHFGYNNTCANADVSTWITRNGNEDVTDTSRLYHTLNMASVTAALQMSSTYNDRTPTYA